MDFIKVLFSGSKGNSALFVLGNTKIIIDAGVSRKRLCGALEDLNLNINGANILVTHHHSDHIKGLKQILKKDNVNLYGSKEICDRLENTIELTDILLIDDVEIEVINLSHDANLTFGYILSYNDYKIVYISDTGYLSEKNLSKIKNPDILLLESNHDVNMLMNGSYSWDLKNRVISDYGHLSNIQFKTYVNKVKGDNTRYLVALHLSEDNNSVDIVNEMFIKMDVVNCFVASQTCGCETIKLDWK